MCIVTPIDRRSETWSTGLMTSRPRSFTTKSQHCTWHCLAGDQAWGGMVIGSRQPGLLTSKMRSFQMGVPSFSMGAAGAGTPLECGSSFSLGSMDSLRLRIFLIETWIAISPANKNTTENGRME